MNRYIQTLTTLLLAFLPHFAHAAIEVSPPVFGFDGTMFTNRSSCLTIQIDSDASPFQGALIVSYESSGTVIENRVVPFAVTPGIPTHVTAITTPYSPNTWMTNNHKYTIQIRSRSGALLHRFVYSSQPRSTEIRLDDPPSKNQPVVLICGSIPGSLLDASDDLISDLETDPNAEIEDPPATALEDIQPREMTDEDRAELQRKYALGAWELRCSTPGMPRIPEAYEAIEAAVIDSCTLSQLDPAQREALIRWAKLGGRLVLLIDCEDTSQSASLHQLLPLLAPSGREALISPTASLSDRLRAWSRQVIEGAPVLETQFGLGRLVVIDQKTIAAGAQITSATFWEAVLEPILSKAEFDEDNMYAFRNNQAQWPAVNLFPPVLALHGDVPVPPFWPLAIALALFAIIVGPILARIIRRKPIARFSWALTVLIISVASAGAWVYPDLVRTQESWAATGTLIDAVIDENGRSFAAQTSLVILGSGASGQYKLDDTLASRWRPVHPPMTDKPARALPLTQLPDKDILDAIPARVWQIRPVLFEASSPLADVRLPSCSVTIDTLDRISARVVPVSGQNITGVRIHTAALGSHMLVEEQESGAWLIERSTLEERELVEPPPWRGATRLMGDTWGQMYSDDMLAILDYASFESVPAVTARVHSIASALESGNYALVLIDVEDEYPRVAIEGVGEHKSRTLYRILIPVEQQEGVAQ